MWSLPSESDLIWDQFCHPRLRHWSSEVIGREEATPELAREIRNLFDAYLCPSSFWRQVEKTGLIWNFNRNRRVRAALRSAYRKFSPILRVMFTNRSRERRIVEKTASNCFRLGFVNRIFPDAKIIYPTREGKNSVNSLINGWQHPERFFTYDVPEPLNIEGYSGSKWKFVLPPGWRQYLNSPLEEVCAFQWASCHTAMQAEISRPAYRNRILQIKLEDLINDPSRHVKQLVDFAELPFDGYFRSVAANLPLVNSPDQLVSADKWMHQNRARVERIIPIIEPTMTKLGYE
jgi:hypothetical protein